MDTLDSLRKRFNENLHKYLMECEAKIPQRLWLAMKYSLEQKGKRLRPLLVYATGLCLGATLEKMDSASCAVEFVHVFSLIHDDLPSMDNDDFRRNKPTCHKQFDEATAILAGDALITQISDVIFYDNNLDIQQKLNILHALLQASGSCGMIGGQILDIQQTSLTSSNLTKDCLLKIYALKTGELFKSCIKLGYICSGCQVSEKLQLLEEFIYCFGLAFQIKDDLDDVIINNLSVTKKLTTDDEFKLNYANIFGVDEAKEKMVQLKSQAMNALDKFVQKHNDSFLLRQILAMI